MGGPATGGGRRARHRDGSYLFFLNGRSLHEACAKGNLHEVELSLNEGYSVLELDSYGKSPLHYIALLPDEEISIHLAKRLLIKGANPNIRDAIGHTPLSLAYLQQRWFLVSCLEHDLGARLTAASEHIFRQVARKMYGLINDNPEQKDIYGRRLHDVYADLTGQTDRLPILWKNTIIEPDMHNRSEDELQRGPASPEPPGL